MYCSDLMFIFCRNRKNQLARNLENYQIGSNIDQPCLILVFILQFSFETDSIAFTKQNRHKLRVKLKLKNNCFTRKGEIYHFSKSVSAPKRPQPPMRKALTTRTGYIESTYTFHYLSSVFLKLGCTGGNLQVNEQERLLGSSKIFDNSQRKTCCFRPFSIS